MTNFPASFVAAILPRFRNNELAIEFWITGHSREETNPLTEPLGRSVFGLLLDDAALVLAAFVVLSRVIGRSIHKLGPIAEVPVDTPNDPCRLLPMRFQEEPISMVVWTSDFVIRSFSLIHGTDRRLTCDSSEIQIPSGLNRILRANWNKP